MPSPITSLSRIAHASPVPAQTIVRIGRRDGERADRRRPACCRTPASSGCRRRSSSRCRPTRRRRSRSTDRRARRRSTRRGCRRPGRGSGTTGRRAARRRRRGAERRLRAGTEGRMRRRTDAHVHTRIVGQSRVSRQSASSAVSSQLSRQHRRHLSSSWVQRLTSDDSTETSAETDVRLRLTTWTRLTTVTARLFRPKRERRIDACRPPRRETAGGKRDGEEDGRGRAEADEIEAADVEQQAASTRALAAAAARPIAAPQPNSIAPRRITTTDDLAAAARRARGGCRTRGCRCPTA